MGTVATTTPPSASSVASNIANAQQSLGGDQQTFLKLLTTQLQNQDPLNPMNTDQFTQQLVSMTGVQQQILTNELLQQMVGNQTGVGEPVSLLGKSVTATSPNATLQAGQAHWAYSLNANAADVQLTVTNNIGQTVYQSDAGPQTMGQQAFSWNGKTADGIQLPDGGTYTLAVTAKDAAGNSLSSSIYQQGVVSAVTNSGGQVMLTINGSPVPASGVTTVQSAQ
jgi:flagellar basal-body rod modification protein FlgD